MRLRTRNAVNLLGLDAADWGQTPTEWQRQPIPAALLEPHQRRRMKASTPASCARRAPRAIWLEGGLSLSRDDEVITYCARNLEPYRGFHIFMRALAQCAAAAAPTRKS